MMKTSKEFDRRPDLVARFDAPLPGDFAVAERAGREQKTCEWGDHGKTVEDLPAGFGRI
jgi:hypothetical protein